MITDTNEDQPTQGRHLLTVEVGFEDLEDVAHSVTVDVALARHNFSMNRDRRATLRTLVDATDRSTDGDE